VNNRNIRKDNWFNDTFGTDRVMAELQKCGQYFKEAIPVISSNER